MIDPLTQGEIFSSVKEICKKNNIILERTEDSFGGLAYYYKFKKINSNEKLNESLKLSNGKYAVDEETKKVYEEYMKEIDRYNEQVANGETPNIKFGDLLNKYRDTFYDDELENKLKKIDEDYEKNKEKNLKEIDELITQINEKLIKIEEQAEILNFETKEEAIEKYTKKFGGFPYFLFMGASEENIITAIEEALKTGKKITINQEEKENNNY